MEEISRQGWLNSFAGVVLISPMNRARSHRWRWRALGAAQDALPRDPGICLEIGGRAKRVLPRCGGRQQRPSRVPLGFTPGYGPERDNRAMSLKWGSLADM